MEWRHFNNSHRFFVKKKVDVKDYSTNKSGQSPLIDDEFQGKKWAVYDVAFEFFAIQKVLFRPKDSIKKTQKVYNVADTIQQYPVLKK